MAKKAAAKKTAAKKKSTAKKKPTRKKSASGPAAEADGAKNSPAKTRAEKRRSKTTAAKQATPSVTSSPSESGREFPDLIESQPDEIRRIARSLRGLVIGTLSNVVESIVGSGSAGLAVYKRSGRTEVLCGIQPVGDACLLYVQNVESEGTEAVELPGLELRGNGKNSRHVRFESMLDIAHKQVRSLLQQVESRSQV